MATTAAAQTPVITARQWKEHKQHILSLYVDMNWPLRLVRQALAAKGFEPSESQYRTRFKEWRIHKKRKSKTAKKIPTTSSDEPEQKSSIVALEAPRPLLPLTVERTAPLHHTSLFHNQEATYPNLTEAADRFNNNDNNNNHDWDPTSPRKAAAATATATASATAYYPYITGAAGRISDNDEDNLAGAVVVKREPVGESSDSNEFYPNHDETLLYRMPIYGLEEDDTFHAEACHVGLLSVGDQSSFETSWDELEAYLNQ